MQITATPAKHPTNVLHLLYQFAKAGGSRTANKSKHHPRRKAVKLSRKDTPAVSGWTLQNEIQPLFFLGFSSITFFSFLTLSFKQSKKCICYLKAGLIVTVDSLLNNFR